MKSRILIDSCVLLSASVFVSSKDIDEETPLKHKFYEECRELFTYIQKNLAKRIGIITSTVENEAVGVLDKVIEGELKHRGFSRSNDFEIFSRVFNICDIKMLKSETGRVQLTVTGFVNGIEFSGTDTITVIKPGR